MDLSKTKTIGLAADRRFKTTIKYVPTVLPTNPSLRNRVLTIDINKEYIKSDLGEDVSA